MRNFLYQGKIVDAEDDVLTQAILQECYKKSVRPICACLPEKEIDLLSKRT